jgi:hypothetical protein
MKLSVGNTALQLKLEELGKDYDAEVLTWTLKGAACICTCMYTHVCMCVCILCIISGYVYYNFLQEMVIRSLEIT